MNRNDLRGMMGQRQAAPDPVNPGQVVARPAARSTFVPAAPKPAEPPAIAQLFPPVTYDQFPSPAVQQSVTMQTSEMDRARSFVYVSVPLCAAFGVLTAIVAVYYQFVPLLSLGTLLAFFVTFCVSWLATFFLHVITSPHGTVLANLILQWRHMRMERNFRHQIIVYYVKGQNDGNTHP